MLTWLPDLSSISGLTLNSPASGQLLPLSAHPDLLYNSNVLTDALCIKLQQGTLRAPFNGQYDSRLLNGRRLRFRHSSGLTMQLDLPINKATLAYPYRHEVGSGCEVTVGQQILSLDLQALQECYAVLMLLPNPAILASYSCSKYVEASVDTAIIIQTLTKN